MANQEKSKSGCFSNFIKLLFSSRNGASPPVYPSDHVEETEHHVLHKTDKKHVADVDVAPNVIARLMGLDSLPKTNFVVKKNVATQDLVSRSRSVNFVDYLLEFDINHANNNQHRRVKTSASFREVPTLFQRQKSDPFVLHSHIDECVAKVEEEKKLVEWKQRKKQGNKQSKEIVVVRVKKERNYGKNKKISKLKNEPRRVPLKVQNFSEGKDLCKSCSYYSDVGSCSSSSSSLVNNNRHKKGFVEPKMRNNMKKQILPKKMQIEHSLENLSPVSVLDVNDYHFLDGADFQGSRSRLGSKSKCKSSLKVRLDESVKEKGGNNKSYADTDINRETEYYSELMHKIRTLTEVNIRDTDFTSKVMSGTETVEEISMVFAHNIFDLLLLELVNEVVQFSS